MPPLVSAAKELRAAGLRAFRHLFYDEKTLSKILEYRIDIFIVRWKLAYNYVKTLTYCEQNANYWIHTCTLRVNGAFSLCWLVSSHAISKTLVISKWLQTDRWLPVWLLITISKQGGDQQSSASYLIRCHWLLQSKYFLFGLKPFNSIHNSVNRWWEYSNLSGSSCYLNLVPSSHN